MASKVPYYYSELKKGAVLETERNNLNKVEDPYEKGHGFDNPLLAIEPDIVTCDVPEKASTFQKKKKKKKILSAPIYKRSNSLIAHGRLSSNSSKKEMTMASPEKTSSGSKANADYTHRRRSSEPNIYEEIPEVSQDDTSCYSGSVRAFPLASQTSWRTLETDRVSTYSSKVLDEVEKVQQRHAKILEDLNLDVEAMLMPEDGACSEDLGSDRDTSVYVEHKSHANSDTKASRLSSAGMPSYFATSAWPSSSGCYTLPKPESTSTGRRVMNEYILQQSDFGPNPDNRENQKANQRFVETTYAEKPSEEPLYMLYDDTHRQRSSSRASGGHQTPEDNIYEEVDLQHCCIEDFDDAISWADSEIPIEQSASSASEENDDMGASKITSRFIGKKKKSSRKHVKDAEGIAGGFTRWFSTRKKEYDMDKGVNRMSRLSHNEETYVDVKIPKKQRPPLSLPPMPTGLSPENVKRRYIVSSIVDSENSYVNSLQRLIRDYKHPLEDATPQILSANKISVMFHRLEQILQCHNIFGIALTQCVRQWDQEEKIGDVFVSSFSKTMILDIYSEFINNFSVAMETAKQAAKNKSAFTEFLKAKQMASSDRLSFFGLMVKPVQRFPQFIMLLQDLLKHTPTGHHDRMSLQLALTQLESLAETLNERKREAEQHHAVREVLKHLGKFSLKSLSDRDHYLLRQDDVVQLLFDQSGLVVKSKDRRLFLLNDLLVSVSVTTRTTDGSQSGERLNLKWAVPLYDVDVQEDVAPATRNLIASSGRQRNSGAKFPERQWEGGTVQALYDELSDLVHDLEVSSRISALVSSLRRPYNGLNFELLQGISHSIQEQIRQKDEEITRLDSCCLQLSLPLKSKSAKEMVCFQMRSPSIKREWTTELRMAKLALDVNNTPAWDVSDQEKRPSCKMPLFVKAFSTYQSSCSSEVTCGCHYTVYSSSVPQQYLWLCSSDGTNSHLVIMAVHLTHLRQVAVYHLNETHISLIEAVPATSPCKSFGSADKTCNSDKLSQTVETVWMGTNGKKLLILEGSCPEKWEEIGSVSMISNILQIKYHWDQVFVALGNGNISVFHRETDGQWQLQNPTVVSLDQDPVTDLLPLGLVMYCASGPKIWVVDALTVEVQKHYVIDHDSDDHAFLLAHSGTGLWVAMKNSSLLCLYHTETFRHLQDVNISSSVNRILGNKDKCPPHSVSITSLIASKGLLWVGTSVGILLTVPLPRLEGVPIITGKISSAYHSHYGPVNFLLSLQTKAVSCPQLSSVILRRPASADGDTDSLVLSPRNKVMKQISDSVLSSHVSRKDPIGFKPVGDVHLSGAKTLPRSITLCSYLSQHDIEESNDVYGLYADLMNVHDYEKDSQEKLYERLNHSDPELVNFHHSTLDQRTHQKTRRPRSWDLTAMAVSEDSDSSTAHDAVSTVTTTTSTTETSIPSTETTVTTAVHSPVHQVQEESPSHSTQITLGRAVCKSRQKSLTDSAPKTVLMLSGGCGYIDWRKSDKDKKPNADSYVMIWEVKL